MRIINSLMRIITKDFNLWPEFFQSLHFVKALKRVFVLLQFIFGQIKTIIEKCSNYTKINIRVTLDVEENTVHVQDWEQLPG